jgi:photosystem I reaction center subunit XII|uniref:Photosystem I reaction center subunit XII n=1 Tax=Symbiochloris handae TaxID=1853882 RepID=A0A097KJG5_9CHLO|nr:M polypeptide of photosystem I [Symbiochloris handae]AIT93331.1 M polypeptide of photosystem I [Symbiochloris handae]
MMLSDNDVFTALFLALVTGALAVRLAIALYV